jgi:hypothetical protein
MPAALESACWASWRSWQAHRPSSSQRQPSDIVNPHPDNLDRPLAARSGESPSPRLGDFRRIPEVRLKIDVVQAIEIIKGSLLRRIFLPYLPSPITVTKCAK